MCTEQSPAGNASFFLQPTRVWIACIWPKDMQRLKEIATLMAGFSTKNDLHSMKLPSWWSFPIGFARRQGPCTSCKHRPCCDSCLGEFATAGSTTYPQGSDCEARYFCRWHALSTDLIDLGRSLRFARPFPTMTVIFQFMWVCHRSAAKGPGESFARMVQPAQIHWGKRTSVKIWSIAVYSNVLRLF